MGEVKFACFSFCSRRMRWTRSSMLSFLALSTAVVVVVVVVVPAEVGYVSP